MNVPPKSSMRTSSSPNLTCTCGGSNGSSLAWMMNEKPPSWTTVGIVSALSISLMLHGRTFGAMGGGREASMTQRFDDAQ